jgi:hypothetical protein
MSLLVVAGILRGNNRMSFETMEKHEFDESWLERRCLLFKLILRATVTFAKPEATA